MEKAFEIQLFLEVHTKQGLLMGGKKMGNRKWEHLIISPDYVPPVMDDERDDKGDIKTGRTLGQTYSSSDLFPDCKVNMSLSWFYEIPNKNPYVDEHVHDVDELVFSCPITTGWEMTLMLCGGKRISILTESLTPSQKIHVSTVPQE